MSMNNIHSDLDTLCNQLTVVDLSHANADTALSTVLLAWLNTHVSTLDTPTTRVVLEICRTVLGRTPILDKAIESLENMNKDPESVEYNPGLAALTNIHTVDLNSFSINPIVAPVTEKSKDTISVYVEEPTVEPVVVELVVDPQPDEIISKNTMSIYVEEPALEPKADIDNTPSVIDTLLEDISLANGIAIISSEDWRKSKFQRTTPVLVKNFDFRHLDLPDLGRAGYMLIAPNKSQDVRIEVRSQSVSGSAGDKLPVIIRKFRRLQQSKEYGQTFIGIVGNIGLFSEDSLSLAREEAVKSGRIIYAEGEDTVEEALSVVLNNVAIMYKPNVPVDSPMDQGNYLH